MLVQLRFFFSVVPRGLNFRALYDAGKESTLSSPS